MSCGEVEALIGNWKIHACFDLKETQNKSEASKVESEGKY